MSQSDRPHLRRTTRDLWDAVAEIREEQIPEIEDERETVVKEAEEEYGDPDDAPPELHRRYRQLTQVLRELHGTADGLEHYAEVWGEDGEAVFELEELNGDEYAATVDAVSQEARNQARQDGDLPEGYGRIKALEYGVIDIPEGCPPDPGQWPAVVVNDLFEQLNDITAPSGVDLGNESLSEAMSGETDATETFEFQTQGGGETVDMEADTLSTDNQAVRNLQADES